MLASRLIVPPTATHTGPKLKPKGMMLSSASAPVLKTLASSRVEHLRSTSKLNSSTVLMGKLETLGGKSSAGTQEFSNTDFMESPEHDMTGTNFALSPVKSKQGTFMESLNLNIKEKYELLHVAQSFFYLRVRAVAHDAVQGVPMSVYDLEKVNQDDIDKNFYFTLSKEGITQYRNKVSTFTTIIQWEREYKLFYQISQIKFFTQYKRWKAFTVWKKSIRSSKIHHSSELLSSNLFIFNSSLRSALLTVRKMSMILVTIGLLNWPENTTFDLEDFVRSQNVVHSELRNRLGDLSGNVLATVRAACDEVVDQFLKLNNIVASHKMTFMERASLRAECRKLTRFLRLVDIMMRDFLKTMVQEAVQSLVTAVEAVGPNALDPQIELEPVDNSTLAAKRTASDTKTPLFRVAVNFRKDCTLEEGTIHMSPSLEMLSVEIENVITDCLGVVSSFTTVFDSPDTEMFVMPDGEDDGEGEGSNDVVDIAAAIKSNAMFLQTKTKIHRQLKHAFAAARRYSDVFEPYRQLFFENKESAQSVETNFANSDVEYFQEAIATYRGQLDKFSGLPCYTDVGTLFMDSKQMKDEIIPSPTACLQAIQDYLPQLAFNCANVLYDQVSGMNLVIAADPSSVEEYVAKKQTKEVATAELDNIRNQQSYVRNLVMLLEDNEWAIPDNVKAVTRSLKDSIVALENNIVVAEGKEEEEVKKFSTQVTEEVPRIVKRITDCREMLDKDLISDPSASDDKVLKFLTATEADFIKLKERAGKMQDYEVILKMPVDEFELIDEVNADMALKMRLWKDKHAWSILRDNVMNTPFATLDVPALDKQLMVFNKTVTLAGKGLPTNRVVPVFKQSVDEFNPVLPLVNDLRSPCLRPRHWEKITNLVGMDIQAQEDMTLAELIENKITTHQEEISSIATAAQQESILEEMLAKVIAMWEKCNLDVLNYKDIKDLYILGETAEVIANLDDSLVTVNTVLGSRYVAGIRDKVDTWRGKLLHFQDTMDEWLTCQSNWIYLETIFSSADIVRQLPGPAKVFQNVDKSFRSIMKQTYDEPNALNATTKDRTRLEVFRQHNANLDQIQKDLEDYLETKRMAFPRFYFLSNDELLEILSQAKEPRAVQPHLIKCFDNLTKLRFGAEDGSVDILAMFSGDGEEVGLGKNLKARGNVEEWMTAVEKRMKESLHLCMKAGLIDYDVRPREEWIGCHPGQVVATVAQMTWARSTEAALKSDDPLEAMRKWCILYKEDLQNLIKKIRGQLTKLVRNIIVALVTTDVHARDIIDEMYERQVRSCSDFVWQQQLRYYWTGFEGIEYDDCVINHSDAKIRYGYEYMGATSRLVITPLTDRCWMTLTGAYALKLGAAPAGPAGTGKTESSKDLAKAIGIQCVVFNCSDQIDYKMMGKLFRGLAQSGSWICLDEFNRIDIEVLSVIAQQLLVLREGRQAKKANINFMGIQIGLIDHHVIITMNPGYAGRTELPDNLAVCFRPVSMMVPNYALIAEIMLFAEGFGDAKNLSKKMCKLYILCSEQLSQQPHYDYGLRAVKSVLVMAGGLKRANPDLTEDLVLIRALRDSNVPKFLADDLPLFAAIVQDLFPGVEVPPNDYGELQVSLEAELKAAGMQIVPAFLGKLIQMFDIFTIRFGATLVGPAGSGKTTIYRILANVMSSLRDQGSPNPLFQKVTYRILNPKSLTMGELYGEFSALTQEWHDGLAASILREYAGEESETRRWTVFDGPIDALWIENMNTVLDDNMTLCLANGQRIKLKKEMKCLFEVNDLAVASPATVSRIGVVYVTPSDLGWLPFVHSWAARALPEGTPEAVINRIFHLFEKPFAKGLANQRKYYKEAIVTVDIQAVTSLCVLFQSLFVPGGAVKLDAAPADLQLTVDKLFFFSYVWSIGASLNPTFWEQFSDHTRELFEEDCAQLGVPGRGIVFDYFVDLKEGPGKFREWADIVPSFEYSDNVPYFSLVVPTVDTCRFSYVMKSLITVDKPCFISGVTGTGKTVAVQSLLNSLQPMPYDGGMGIVPLCLTFSAQTQSLVVQQSIESKLEKKRKNLLGAPSGKKMVIFVDDVNMPTVETYGAQPPVELIRQFLDHKGFYDRDKLFFKDVVDVLLFAGAAPPGGGRAVVTPRFSRHFNVLTMPMASDSALTVIFQSILAAFLLRFEGDIQRMGPGVVAATIEIYNKISEELLPTPAKFHYTFNMRDISKVFQGILMIKPRRCADTDTFSKLFVHEAFRIFYDRLINEEDQLWFKKTTLEMCSRHLKMSYSEDDLYAKPIVFADFLKPDADPRFYEYVPDLNKLTAVVSDLLDNYNAEFPTQMNLVFFIDALTHTARISRIMRQPRGNAMLIGVGGSGKQSLTKMSAFVCNMQCLSIEICRGYDISNFREDMKNFFIITGVEGKDLAFLFTDSQIVDETMLEDLNNVLNTGEIPNLFPQDEIDKILSDMIPVCREDGIPETRDNCLAHFISRIRDKLHIVLAMSPVGDALRIRCRQFPSLINCCTIDWFHGWPEAALVSVAERFLADLELPDEDVRAAVVRMCGFVHRSIEQESVVFFNELRRRVYTTPKSYLDLISLYMSMLKELQGEVDIKTQRMIVGVDKLEETNSIVETLRGELVKLEPVLVEKTIEAEGLLASVAVDSADAAIVAEKVGSEEAIVSKQAAETKLVADDAQKDLDRALPALESAVKALKSLTKADITEVKSFTNPPKAVQVVMDAVCVMLGEKEGWDTAKKLLGRSDFMEMLTGYDKDNIPEAKLKKLRKTYINLDEMNPDVVAKVSKAGLGLCLWVRAMDVYSDVAKEVGPKKEKLAVMNEQLASANAMLFEKQTQLKVVLDKVAALQKLCDDTVKQKNDLQNESDQTAKRLVRAEKLTSGLNSEGVRWKATIIQLNEEKTNLVGDAFLSCACISYYGGFTGVYRQKLTDLWMEQSATLEIPCTRNFSLSNTLGNPVVVREWQTQGLPSDDVSVSNGILVDKCRRWPLMIDPQQQANKWIRKKEAASDVMITTMRDPNMLRVLENCIRNGKPLLLEELGENLEPALEPVLQKAVYKQGTRLLIRIGDSDIDYDKNFRLFMTTKLPNPHYLPETCIKVTLINFTVTMDGLESQLLGDVVAKERPDIELRKIQLMLQMADDKKQLQMLEAKILQLLSESEGNILDDEVLINTLSDSKATAITIGERVAEAEITEVEINDARSQYQCVATRGSIIYFVLADLSGIDPMYQYSLAYYCGLFNKCITDSEKSTNLDTRLTNIIDYATLIIYQIICRGLFEKDKLLFSSSICFQIAKHSKKIHDLEWGLFMRGPGAVDRTHQPTNPAPQKVSAVQWDLLYAMQERLVYMNEFEEGSPEPDNFNAFSTCHPFDGLMKSLISEFEKWQVWARGEVTTTDENGETKVEAGVDIMRVPLPGSFDTQINDFQKLLLVKALREDKLMASIGAYVRDNLGPDFAQSPSCTMEDIYKDLDNKTPCIFILSSGADPTSTLLRFAKKRGYGDRLHIVSLGQGQGPIAKRLIEEGCKHGDWVCLQNCMLAKSWMNELDKIVFDIQERVKISSLPPSQQSAEQKESGGVNHVSKDFRLFLTSTPCDYFPVSILQNGIKMTNEPPKGFRANLLKSFASLIKEEDYENCAKSMEWKKLLCGLAFFHANIQERRKFGPLGWNIRYAFDESDLETSVAVLRRFLEEQEHLPWDALNYVTGHINYGGRVTDDWDRRCLLSVLSLYMVPSILDDSYKFSASGKYFASPAGTLAAQLAYFESLPGSDAPEVFGMHENANVTFTTNESLTLMETMLSLQPRSAGGGSGMSSDDMVVELANGFESTLPEILDMDDAGPTTFIIQSNDLLTSLAICLTQEMVKFNRLLTTMAGALRDIKKAIRGLIVMSHDLDQMYTAMLTNKVPPMFESVSFASLKTLASWVVDLVDRVKFMRKWLTDGEPSSFPLPVFFFPQGFMTASLQTYARKHMEAIDGLLFEYHIKQNLTPENITEGPPDGVYLYGLYLEGARFDANTGLLEDSLPGVMYELLPMIHFQPAVNHKQFPNTYACPVYKTAVRKGVLSTTGMSTNYVVPVELPSDKPEQKWILAGVAALLNLTD